jgi:alpha-glucosidase
MYFYSKEPNAISAYNPLVVKEFTSFEAPDWKYEKLVYPYKFQPYIARTAGSRTFPWRVVAVAEQPKDLLNNEIVYKLSRPNALKDVSWIKPGKVAWDWWNDWNFERVDFKAGVNTATYKAYIDFAAKNKLEYIVMDEGWYFQPDLSRPISNIDMPELVRYAKEKNVDIILWVTWRSFNQQINVVPALYEQWGIKGVKIDFIERDDQEIPRLLEMVAKTCAEHHLLVDFHGCPKPTGLNRAYPNVVNYEGLKGMEQSKWCKDANPDNALLIPFIRMFNGPIDYTPGAMLNAQADQWVPNFRQPMSQGTRCQQLAMYVVYDSPLNMLSDNPSNYAKEQESTDFIAKVPTVWDETVPLDAKVGEYAVVARRNGSTWFVGAMTNWQERDVEVDLSFLPTGMYVADFFQDGINANKKATDYKRTVSDVSNTTKLKVHLAKGGGCAMRISLK